MKGGGAVYMKETIVLPEEEIRAEPWYGEAVEHPNTVALGGYDTSQVRLTGNIQKGNQLVVATALATDLATDKSGEIEVVTFFTISQVSDVLAAQNRDGDMGFSVILDGSGQVIYGDTGREFLRAAAGGVSPRKPNPQGGAAGKRSL